MGCTVGREPGRLVISPGGVISWMQLPSSAPTPSSATRWNERANVEGDGGRGKDRVRRCALSSTPGEMAIECISR